MLNATDGHLVGGLCRLGGLVGGLALEALLILAGLDLPKQRALGGGGGVGAVLPQGLVKQTIKDAEMFISQGHKINTQNI